MAVIWPLSLPQSVQVAGYAESFPNNIVRTQMEAGPAKMRPRFTAATRDILMPFKLTKAQINTLNGFYTNTLAYGTQPFTFKHPINGTPADFRFKSPPKLQPCQNEPEIWDVVLDVEIMP